MQIPGKIREAFEAYLSELCNPVGEKPGKEASELRYRVSLENLLKKLNNKVSYIHEPGRAEDGSSCVDFGVLTPAGEIGYIETKRRDKNLYEELKKDQIHRYSNLPAKNLLLTNYLNFIWIRNGKIYQLPPAKAGGLS